MSGDRWVREVFRPVVVGVMVACVTLSLVDLAELFFPGWSGTYVVVISFLAALEANYSYRMIRRRGLRGEDVVRFRIIEMAVLFVLLRVGSLLALGWPGMRTELRAWPLEPWRILSLEVAYGFVLVLLSWTVSTATTHDLERIGEPPVQDRYYVYPADALISRFFWGGALLLVSAGLTRVGVSALLDVGRPSVPGLVLNVLVYFALGLVMLGQVEYARLSQRWRKEGIDVPEALAGHWARYTLLFLALTALIAFLLPTGYTLPLLDAIGVVLGAIFYVAQLLFQLAILLFLLIAMPLAMLLGIDVDVEPPPGPEPPRRPPAPDLDVPMPGWFEVIRSVAFWIVAVGVVVYVVRSYLRDRPELTEAVTSLNVFRALREFVSGMWRRLRGAARAARERLPARPRLRKPRPVEEADGGGGLFRFFRLGGLSPRQRTLYYYLSILRRAAEQGYPRERSQTPYEYDAELGPEVPQAEEEMDRLTDTFVEARYSTHPIEDEQERRVRVAFKRIRTALRSLRRRGKAEKRGQGGAGG